MTLTKDEKYWTVEYWRCKENILYFIWNYVYFEEIGGICKYSEDKMNPKFKRVIKSLLKYKFAMLMASRQLGKSTVAAAILEHSMNFFPGNKALILNANKYYALENLSKVKFIHENLPSQLRTPLKYKGDRKTYLEYTNNSKITVLYPSTTTSPDSLGRSLTIPILYIDEAAHIPHMEDIFSAAAPTLTTAAKQAEENKYPHFILMTTTPNGTIGVGEFFHEMWKNGIDSDDIFDESDKFIENADSYVHDMQTNGYVKVEYHWSEDSVKDENWYQQQCRMLNFNQRKINQELDLLFIGSTLCIFPDAFLESLKPKKAKYKIDLPHQTKMSLFIEHFNTQDVFLLGVDTAKSITGNYCALELFQYTNFLQVGEMFAKIGSVTKFGQIIVALIEYLLTILDRERIILCIERNSMGNQVVEDLEDDYFDMMYHVKGKPENRGIYTSPKSKEIMISLVYESFLSYPESIQSVKLIQQLHIIERKVNGSVAAQSKQNDDLFMAAACCAYVAKMNILDIVPLIGIEQLELINKLNSDVMSMIKMQSNKKSILDEDSFITEEELDENDGLEINPDDVPLLMF
jgi:hypothetical protein